MNQFVPDWSSIMGDAAFAPLGGEDDGLIVVMQSQAPRPERAAAVQEHEAAPWFQYPVVDDDSLEKDLFSEIFGEMPADAGRACKEEEEEERGAAVTALRSGPMLPPAHVPREKAGLWDDVGDDARGASVGEGAAATETGGESSVVTIGSKSICGSNHVQTPGAARAVVVSDTAGDSAPPPLGGRNASASRTSHHDASTTVTSSSMRSRPPGAAGRSSGGKRKQRDTAESPSEDVESESAAVTCEPAQKLTTAKRRRAAEVHNLSERRRRDRINEKMKALQELIPHCNKTDKASMLDEAIEYLKSLQLQVQMMWMGGGMAAPAAAPVMFPAGVHQYMQRMASMPRMPLPFMAASPAAQSSPVSHLQPAVGMADTYEHCLAVEHLQPPPSPFCSDPSIEPCVSLPFAERFRQHYLQGMTFYQQLRAMKNPAPPPIVPGGSLPAATARALPPDNAVHRNYENRSRQGMKGIVS